MSGSVRGGISMSIRELIDHETVGVVGTSSCDYVTTMLRLLQEGVVSVTLRSLDDHQRITRALVGKTVKPQAGGGWLSIPFASPSSGELGQVSFTSGTEGAPKTILLSQANLHDVTLRLNAAMRVDGSIREYVGVPVYHSFGYGRCRAILHAGGQCYLPPAGFNLSEIRDLLVQGRINAISAVPSQWRLFLDNRSLFGGELERVRWVEIGSQHMAPAEKLMLRQILPNACIVQHYGLTEASRTTFLRIHEEGESALESVGRAEGRVVVRINERGRIEIQGPHVALAILDGDRVQRLGPEAWLETSDNGALVSGLLYFHGRADDLINCAGVKLSPEHLETAIRQELGVAGDFCIARYPDALRGDGILVALTSDTIEQKTRIVDKLCALAEAQGVAARGAITCCLVDSLPRTATGKVQRRQLAGLAQKSPDQQRANDFASRVQQVFGDRALDEAACFHDLGGDSLVHLEFSLWLERALGTAPANWESKPLAELVRLVAQSNIDPSQQPGTPQLPKGDHNENPKDISFWDLVREDYCTNDSNLLSQGFLMLLIHRFGNWRMGIEPKLVRAPLTVAYRVLNKASQLAFGMKLDYTVKTGRRVKLEHFGGMILGARQIGNDVWIRQNTTFGIRSTDDLNAKPTIGNGVDIGAGAVIVGNITIGDNSVIGANSVVYTNIPRDSVVSGVPGKVVGKNKKLNRSPLTTK